MDYKIVPKKYRPIPFWSWNEKLDVSETKRQAEEMNRIGMGGFFMHARGGLQTEYMSDDWFDNIEAATAQAEKDGLDAWAYDENGWPSGFGSGKVNGLGIDYQQKYLRFEEGENNTDTTIANVDGVHFYYEVNPFYVDTLDGDVTQKFLDEIYQPYYNKFKNRISGFFTDEPQISRNGIPWSFVMPDTYKEMYNEELTAHLIELFKPVGDYKQTRIKFWNMVTGLFSKNFMKKIYDWCDERGLKLTGHLVSEDCLSSQLYSNGACMPHYEYFHIPGVDRLCRNIDNSLAALQMGSAAMQTGKKQTITESYALCGHNVSFSELRGLTDWQMHRGVTLLCPHLEGYSLRGIRKRDYPPAMYEQQPWWEDYSKYIEAMARIGMILTEGSAEYNTLLMHPQTMAWTMFDNDKNEGIDKLNDDFVKTIRALDRKHIMFHLGDETLIRRCGRVEGDRFVIGKQSYNTIVVMHGQFFMEDTKELLDEYKKNGGKIVYESDIKDNTVVDNPNIYYTERVLDGNKIYYFVNLSGEPQTAKFSVGKNMIDIMTGEVKKFDGSYDFLEYDSLLLTDEVVKNAKDNKALPKSKLDLSGSWKVKKCSGNILTLDKCDYYFDGELQEKDGYVLNIQSRACDLKRPVHIRQVYKVNVKSVPDEVFIACETPERFKITVNGREVKIKDCGFLRDRSFRKLDISGLLNSGENEIAFECDFSQPDEVYANIEKSKIFESEKNKLTYYIEIEPVYLSGGFSVYAEDDFTKLDRNALRCGSGFVIDKPTESVELCNIEQQGFLFFAGELTLEKDIVLDDNNAYIELNRSGINSVHVKINDGEEILSIWNGEKIDISSYLKTGINKAEIKLVNNLRNMMGPHHLNEGECISVVPGSFYKEPCVWSNNPEEIWNDDYCFVEMSVY